MTFFAYIHARPNSSTVEGIFYVGKGVRERMSASLSKKRNSYYQNVVKKYGSKNILIGAFECSSEEIAFELEKGLIKCLRRSGVRLTNQTDGGEGISGFKMPESCSGENHPMTRPENRAKVSGDLSPTKRSDVRLKISKANKGRIIDDDWKQKLSESQRKRFISEEERKKVGEKAKGRVRINNGVIEKAVPIDEVDSFFADGWIAGRLFHSRKTPSEETRLKISEANKGRPAHNKGKPSILIGVQRPDDVCDKISKSRIGGRWITDGVVSKYTHEGVLPEGWKFGRAPRKCV